MLIAVEELRLHPVPFDREYAAGAIAADDPEVEEIGPLHVVGQARLVGDGMRIRIQVDGTVRSICARCLEPVATHVEQDADLLYQPEALLEGANEVEIHAADTEVAFFSGAGVELEEVAREQVLLALPMQPLCREDCRGLCPQCGRNLNQGACNCAPVGDQRWASLEQLGAKKNPRG